LDNDVRVDGSEALAVDINKATKADDAAVRVEDWDQCLCNNKVMEVEMLTKSDLGCGNSAKVLSCLVLSSIEER
jgi:hypothetical protein